jgi:hypothetical protein
MLDLIGKGHQQGSRMGTIIKRLGGLDKDKKICIKPDQSSSTQQLTGKRWTGFHLVGN